MSWFESSIMAQKALAQGKPGASNTITEAEQGTYHYTYGPYPKPVLTVDPGAVVACETHDSPLVRTVGRTLEVLSRQTRLAQRLLRRRIWSALAVPLTVETPKADRLFGP